jgi:hypothetical protein
VNSFERSDERFLDGVLSILAGAEKAPRDGQEPSSVAADQFFERGFVAPLKPADQQDVVASAECSGCVGLECVDGHHLARLLFN